jgi:hypothetical protein
MNQRPQSTSHSNDEPHAPGSQARQELLAWDLATALDDPAGIRFYRCCARRYPEAQLRRILAGVMEIPPEKIRRSRAALFNFLIQKHAPKSTRHHRD